MKLCAIFYSYLSYSKRKTKWFNAKQTFVISGKTSLNLWLNVIASYTYDQMNQLFNPGKSSNLELAVCIKVSSTTKDLFHISKLTVRLKWSRYILKLWSQSYSCKELVVQHSNRPLAYHDCTDHQSTSLY